MTCPTCRQPLPRPVCKCGHTEASHAVQEFRKSRGRGGIVLTDRYRRAGCSVRSGPSGIPCGCEAWEPAEGER